MSEYVKAKWAGDSDVLGVGWPVEVLASDPLPGEIIKGRQLPRISARTACWIRCWGPDEERMDRPVYRSCDLCDLDLADEDYKRLSALSAPAPQGIGREALIDLIDGEPAFMSNVMDENRIWLATILTDRILAFLPTEPTAQEPR